MAVLFLKEIECITVYIAYAIWGKGVEPSQQQQQHTRIIFEKKERKEKK